MLQSWWHRWLVELYTLRQTYIKSTVQADDTAFFDFKYFEHKFLPQLE